MHPELDKLKMPEEVYVLEAEDFCKRDFSNNQGQHCLMGWLIDQFENVNTRHVLEPILLEECNKVNKTNSCHSIISFNDYRNRKKETLANVWNRFIARLGYTEIY